MILLHIKEGAYYETNPAETFHSVHPIGIAKKVYDARCIDCIPAGPCHRHGYLHAPRCGMPLYIANEGISLFGNLR